MKRILVSVFLCLVSVGGQAGAQQLISPEQAKAAVRAFENDPNLQFKGEPELDQDISGPAWSHRSWYELESLRGDNYDVDARTGEVVSALYENENRSNVPLDNPRGSRSREDCLQIAQDFARAKYRDFDTMGLTLIEGEWD
ncbi:MAG: PepSY domain-containing protein, partial [Abditibacteriales bacterium]|nr:PepSY domain-containing protein [Abditibacteriales bacterium]